MKEMSLMDHLEELRKALIRIIIILIASFAVCYALSDHIAEFLLAPLRESLAGRPEDRIVSLGILDKLMAQLQVAFWGSIIISSPLWFYQIWSFIRPGLYAREAQAIRPFIVLGFLLFCLGVAFGRFLVFPLTFEVLLNFGVADIPASVGIKGYIALAGRVLVFLGLAFQLPNALLVLGFMGLVTKEGLRSKRPYFYVSFAVLSAALTPPDPYTMLGLWVPLVLLFELGVGAVALIIRPSS